MSCSKFTAWIWLETWLSKSLILSIHCSGAWLVGCLEMVRKKTWMIHPKLVVSKNSVTPKSSNLIGFAIINHPFWGTPIFGNTPNRDPRFLKCFNSDVNNMAFLWRFLRIQLFSYSNDIVVGTKYESKVASSNLDPFLSKDLKKTPPKTKNKGV